jgi:hypothetical protein
MFSGSGGWMGLNRSFPPLYAASAQKVLDAAPDWVLAEHGGPFEFNAEDFRRRVQWAQESARAADALSPSGNHRHDWNPHRVRIEPVVQKAKSGAEIKATLVIDNILGRASKFKVALSGRGLTADQAWELEVPASGSVRTPVALRLAQNIPAGRQVFVCTIHENGTDDGSDAFMALDVDNTSPRR